MLNEIENKYMLSKHNKNKSISNNYDYDFIDIKKINHEYLCIIGEGIIQLYSANDCNFLDTFDINGEIFSSEIINDKIIISVNSKQSLLELYEIKK